MLGCAGPVAGAVSVTTSWCHARLPGDRDAPAVRRDELDPGVTGRNGQGPAGPAQRERGVQGLLPGARHDPPAVEQQRLPAPGEPGLRDVVARRVEVARIPYVDPDDEDGVGTEPVPRGREAALVDVLPGHVAPSGGLPAGELRRQPGGAGPPG